MAKMFPPSVPTGTPMSERKVFDALGGLDDDWIVFHSVAWQDLRHGRQGDGEADFVIAHPRQGITVVEVKGGSIDVVDGQWYSRSRDGSVHEIRNPFDQAVDSKFALRRYLDRRLPILATGLRMGHVVAFPAIAIDGDLSSEAPRAIIWDRYDLRDIERAVRRTSSHWSGTTQFDPTQFKALRQALAPSHHVRTLLSHRVEEVVEELVELTDQQAMVLRFLRRQRRALITGSAGTGKTVLAIEAARRLAADDRRVLLLCHRDPLGEELRRQVADLDSVTAGSFATVAARIVEQAGMSIDGDPDDRSDEAIAELLPDAARRSDLQVDAIVIDEGHEFGETSWIALELLLADAGDGLLVVFADSHRNLYRPGWATPFERPPFELDVNCRNTYEISERVAAVYGERVATLGVHGPKPLYLQVKRPSEVPGKVHDLVARLLRDEGFDPSRITVLAADQHLRDRLTDSLGGDGAVRVETVAGFVGLESDVIVLVLDEIETEVDRAIAYSGMSRARALLAVVGPKQARAALNWD
jgi:NAD(P)-dependent dehydrogenase (short-subunit alcohol dehydrogenase family)